jgi:hypothetical protein
MGNKYQYYQFLPFATVCHSREGGNQREKAIIVRNSLLDPRVREDDKGWLLGRAGGAGIRGLAFCYLVFVCILYLVS